MRVGVVIDDLDRRRGGMSEWCWQFVGAAAARGYELHIVAQGFGVEALPARVMRHRIDRTSSRLAFAESASQILRRLNLDVVHDMGLGWDFDIFQPHGGSYAAWQKRRLDIYSPWWRCVKRPIDALLPRHRDHVAHGRKQYATMQSGATVFVALSNTVANDFVDLHGIRPEQITVVYNGVDCQRFSPDHRARYREAVRRQLGVADETLVLLLAAHNFRLKGVPELLRAAAQFVANQRAVHVVIAGGKHLEKWHRAAGRLAPGNHVTFLGAVADMVPYYAAADAYVHPTYYDPCSLVLLEAAASGLPIVTTRRFNGAAELFRDGENILTLSDPADQRALIESIDALFDERLRQRLGSAARNVALAHPFEKNVAEILRLYDKRVPRRLAA